MKYTITVKDESFYKYIVEANDIEEAIRNFYNDEMFYDEMDFENSASKVISIIMNEKNK